MSTPGRHTSGPANSYAGVHGPNYPDASAFSKAPPECTGLDRQRNATCSKLLVILLIILLLCPLLYMFEDVRVRAVHLAQENAVLKGEMHDLQTKLHDLRGQLTKSKVLPFWEIAKTMNTNMDIWVGTDDPGGGPQFWSYGITTGMFNDNGPPVASTKHHFTHSEAVIIESTEHRRIVGYKIQSKIWDNGRWFATGLIEFGQSGSHDVKFSAKESIFAAEYEVTVYYADWKL